MPAVAAWLVARPYNAILALAITMLAPGLATLSGAILLFLVIRQDLRSAVLAAAVATALILIVDLLVGASPVQRLIGLVSFWLPIVALAQVLRRTRSLTLTLQLAVVVVMLGCIAFFVITSDPAVFWSDFIEATPVLQEFRLVEWKQAIQASDAQFAGLMTALFAIGYWFGLVIVVLLGYWLVQQAPEKSGVFGRFCDLNFGRVIALLLAVTSVVGFVLSAVWIQSIAMLLFAVFWLQGAAIVHWLHASGIVPLFVVFAAYILTIALAEFVIPALAILGYTDAWFRFRHRAPKQLK